jgi:hypothetical protein
LFFGALSINNTCLWVLVELRGLVDSYLLYASVALVVMGVVALVLSVVFRLRLRVLDSVSKGSAANVFNRTFVVFDPYVQTTVFHRLLSFLPFVPLICGFGVAVLLFEVINSGLLLTVLVSILALGLIVVEESPEAYAESKMLIEAIQGGSNLGVGDIRLLAFTKQLLPKLSYYYLGLSAFLFALAAALPFVWAQFLWYFAMFFGYVIQASVTGGLVTWLMALLLYAVIITVFVVLVTMAKSRLFGHQTETVSV